jgi:hypothetical protein
VRKKFHKGRSTHTASSARGLRARFNHCGKFSPSTSTSGFCRCRFYASEPAGNGDFSAIGFRRAAECFNALNWQIGFFVGHTWTAHAPACHGPLGSGAGEECSGLRSGTARNSLGGDVQSWGGAGRGCTQDVSNDCPSALRTSKTTPGFAIWVHCCQSAIAIHSPILIALQAWTFNRAGVQPLSE